MSEWVSELWVRERERERGELCVFRQSQQAVESTTITERQRASTEPGVKDPEGLNLSELRTGLYTLSGSSVGTDLDPDSSWRSSDSIRHFQATRLEPNSSWMFFLDTKSTEDALKVFFRIKPFVATSRFLPTLTGPSTDTWLIPDTLLHFHSLDQTISCLHTSTEKIIILVLGKVQILCWVLWWAVWWWGTGPSACWYTSSSLDAQWSSSQGTTTWGNRWRWDSAL